MCMVKCIPTVTHDKKWVTKGGIKADVLSVIGYEYLVEVEEYVAVIAFQDIIQNKPQIVRMKRDQITEKSLEQTMIKHGAYVEDAKVLFEFYKRADKDALCKVSKNSALASRIPISYTHTYYELDGTLKPEAEVKEIIPYLMHLHSSVGWFKSNDMIDFFAHISLRKDKKVSKYSGDLKIEPHGSWDVYRKMLEECVIGHVEMEAMLAVGASATVLGYMNYFFDANLYNPLVYTYGTSTTGKSTMAKLVASLGACPDKKTGVAFFMTFNSTLNSLLKKVGNNCGYPAVIDELSMNTYRDISNFIYALADGSDKDRLTRGGDEFQDTNSFMTTFLMNGESSILNKCNGNEGLRCRVLEFANIVWTPDAETADSIKAVTKNNYGFLVPMIAEKLINSFDDDQWYDKMMSWQKKFRKDAENKCMWGSVVERIAKMLSLYLVSAEIFSEVTGLQLSYDEIYNFFFQNVIEPQAQDNNIAERTYDAILQHMGIHKEMYEYWSDGYNGSPSLNANQLGIKIELFNYIEKDGNIFDRLLFIPKENMRLVLDEAKLTDINVAMKALNDKGLLNTDGGRHLTSKRRVSSEVVRGYTIRLFQDLDSVNY